MAKNIMIQGTASSVGKSLITAGICRIFRQDGYTVAPFKSQNMALNSYITREGKEMGRAQVVQAEAAGVEPSVEMNPVLLKPTTDKKAQVIIMGEVYRNMSAVEYHRFKPELASTVKNVYEGLASKYEIVVLEGAGSPAEINLRESDIVNMGMAELADAPVILVGDIDRGGVFASVLGTVMLLTEEEKKRVKGVIINKFRGDVEILKPGIKMLEDLIKLPVLGVVPYTKLKIDDEDSLTEKFTSAGTRGKGLDVAVVRLPHISNFTDFNALETVDDACVRYVTSAREMGEPDILILPGSKNTIEDMLFVRQSGIEKQIFRLHRQGTVVFGICGGYQMLGSEIHDPYHTESDMDSITGMGLLDMVTTFREKKVTTQVEAEVADGCALLEGLRGQMVSGYEIHMGITEFGPGCIPYINIVNRPGRDEVMADGVRNESGTVFGTYIHGIFDNMAFTRGFLNNVRRLKGLECGDDAGLSFAEFKEKEYNRLADVLRSSLDMEAIYRIVGLKR